MRKAASMGMSKNDQDLLRIVASDLEFLRDEWGEEVDDHSIRRSSPVLRRLLVENDLHRAWKISGLPGQAIVTASTLDGITRVIAPYTIKFASAGGASYRGAQLRGALNLDYKLSSDQVIRLGKGPVPNRNFRLLDFIEDISVIVYGKSVKRRQIIKYVANKLGGAHFDHSRSKRKGDELFKLLDQVVSSVELLEKPAIYFELLSIGQSVARSEDISHLIRHIKTIV